VAELVNPAPVAVTVTVEVPVGVPGVVVEMGFVPQPVYINIMQASASKPAKRSVLCRWEKSTSMMKKDANVAAAPAIGQWNPFGRCCGNTEDVLAAIVEIVSTVVPLPVTEAGLKLHAVNEGRPEEQDDGVKLIVPV